MPKYNYVTLEDTYNSHRINSENFCEGIYLLTTNIYEFINIDSNEFNNALAEKSKMYMQEVVIGSMEAMVIGMERYTSVFAELRDVATKQIDKGVDTNLSTNGLITVNDNNWSITSYLNTLIIELNDIIFNLRELGGATAMYSYTATDPIYNKIHTKLESVNASLISFPTGEIHTTLEELKRLYENISKFVGHIQTCIVDGVVTYEEEQQLSKQGWYEGYRVSAVDAIAATGVPYFVNRSTNYPLSTIEQEAFRKVLIKIYNDKSGDMLSQLFYDSIGKYDHDKVKFLQESIENIIVSYFMTNGDIPAEYRILTQFAYIFSSVYEYFNNYPGSDNQVSISIEYDKTVGSIITVNLSHSEVREPKGEPTIGYRTIVTGIPAFGELEHWLDKVGSNGSYDGGDVTYGSAFTEYLLGLIVSYAGGSAMQIYDNITGFLLIPKIVSYNDAKANAYVYDMYGFYAIPLIEGNNSLDFIVYPSKNTQNALNAVNAYYPDANLTLEDFNTPEGLVRLNYYMSELDKEFEKKKNLSSNDESDESGELRKYLKSGGV